MKCIKELLFCFCLHQQHPKALTYTARDAQYIIDAFSRESLLISIKI